MTGREAEVRRLWRERSRSGFLRGTCVAAAVLVILSWGSGRFDLSSVFSERRLRNLERFFGEIVPYPLQGQPFDLTTAVDWVGELLRDRGLDAMLITLAMSIVAIVLAGIASSILAPFAARSLASAEPYLASPEPPSATTRLAWRTVVTVTRGAMLFLRAIPEYVWAFLLLQMIGPSAWPAILALALHNTGILGRLGAEILENTERSAPTALRGIGASRAQIAGASLFPAALARALSYFFYRWETCVREATVLGMLGIVSLGFWVTEARAGNMYDEMVLLVLLGAAIVWVGDLVSTFARWSVRNAG